MASYLPYAGKNAIAEVAGGILYAHPLTQIATTHADAVKAALASEFPLYQPMNMVSVNVGFAGMSTGPSVAAPAIGGFTLTKVKNDGSPSRLVRIMANTVSIHILEYDDWKNVKALMIDVLSKIINITQKETPHLINGMFMRVVDRFTFDGPDSDADATLLIRNDTRYLPKIIFSCGAAWHNNSGWFVEKSPRLSLLNQLTVASNPVSGILTVNIDHNINIPFTQLRQNGDDLFKPKNEPSLSDMLEWGHEGNKEIMLDLLVPAVATAIGLA